MTEFQFESNRKYQKYYSRVLKQLYYVLIISGGLFIFIYILGLRTPALYYFFLVPILQVFNAFYGVRNYIYKIKVENDTISIDYSHYNKQIHYSGKANEFDVEKKKSGGSSFKATYCLGIKILKNNALIKQYETLDWNAKIMDDFIAVLNK